MSCQQIGPTRGLVWLSEFFLFNGKIVLVLDKIRIVSLQDDLGISDEFRDGICLRHRRRRCGWREWLRHSSSCSLRSTVSRHSPTTPAGHSATLTDIDRTLNGRFRFPENPSADANWRIILSAFNSTRARSSEVLRVTHVDQIKFRNEIRMR